MPKKADINLSQEQLFIDFKTFIPNDRSLWPQKSVEAASNRKARIGKYALHPRNKGFRSVIRNMWIPYSAGENSTVILLPEPRIVRDKYFAKQRVIDKYAESDKSPEIVGLWAHFSAIATERRLRSKFRSYQINAAVQTLKLNEAVDVNNNEYSRSSIEESDLAIDALCWYLVNLKAYGGRDSEGEPKDSRRWVQERWTNVVKREKGEAQGYLDELNTLDFCKLYEEAFYNNWCRSKYWREVDMEYKNNLKRLRLIPPDYLETPLEVYEAEGY